MNRRTCATPGCARDGKLIRGYCNAHYRWLKRRGLIPLIQGPNRTVEERFFQKVQKTDDCWLWTGAKSTGYGRFFFNGSVDMAHRVAYVLFIGPIPDGYEVDHTCSTRSCVRPEHLEAVTPDENKARYAKRILFCVNGHELAEGAYYVMADGVRRCAACSFLRSHVRYRAERDALGLAPGEYRKVTHCKRGHLFDEGNTRVRSDGKRDCRKCCAEKARRARAAAKEKAA